MRGAWLTVLVILLPVLAGSCLGVVREAYYEVESVEGRPLPRESPQGRTYAAPSRSNEVELIVLVDEYAPYEVLSGPLVAWVIPLFLVSWMWHEPLPEDSLAVRIAFRGPRDRLVIEADEIVLGLPDGTRLPPSEAELSDSPGLRNTYRFTEAAGDTLELLVEGVYLDGAPQSFAPLTLRRTRGWRIMGIGMNGRVLPF